MSKIQQRPVRRLRLLLIAAALLLPCLGYAAYVRLNFGMFNPFGVPERIEFNGWRYYPSGNDIPTSLRLSGIKPSDLVTVSAGALPPAIGYLAPRGEATERYPVTVYVRVFGGGLHSFTVSGDPWSGQASD